MKTTVRSVLLSIALIVLSACSLPSIKIVPSTTSTPTPNMIATINALQTQIANNQSVAPVAATAAPVVNGSPVPDNHAFADMASFSVSGAPASVNKANVLFANGGDAYGNTFTNTTGLGSQQMFANPGSILYGPDEPASTVKANPHGEYISPITQHFLGTDTWSDNVAEGAFLWATGARMNVKVGAFTIIVNSTGKVCDNNWFVLLRGRFADGKQDSDLNTTAHFSNYVAGHTQTMLYPKGAYISEENFLQVAQLSHTDGRNCGAEGTSGLSVLMLDLNTGAYTVIYQSNLNQPWQFVASNWYQP